MKYFILLITFCLGTTLNAQDSIEKTISEFSTVKVYDLIQLKMKRSDENKIVISGKNKRDVEVINKNGVLKIRMNIEESYDGQDTEVMLYFTAVDVIDANEGAFVMVNETLEQNEIDLRVQEGASIKVRLKTTYANFRAVTGGEIIVSGTSKNQDITIYTGGTFNGEHLKTEISNVSINAAGEAHVNASLEANVKIKAGGNVYIYGNPKEVNESTLLGGSIKRM